MKEQWIRIQVDEEYIDALEDYPDGDEPFLAKGKITKIHSGYPGDELCEPDGTGRHDVVCRGEDLDDSTLSERVLFVIWYKGCRVILIPEYNE